MEELGTNISTTGRDVHGNFLKGEGKRIVKRISKLDKREKSKGKKTIRIANTQINKLCQVLGISEKIKQRGDKIFIKYKKHKIRVKNIECFSAACLYVACREAGLIKTIKDFTEKSNCKRIKFEKDTTKIIDILIIQTKIMKPIEYISRIGSKTIPPISGRIQKESMDLLEELVHNKKRLTGMDGKNPMGIAAAALWYTCELRKTNHTLKSIAAAADLNVATVRDRKKDIIKFKKGL